MDTFALLSIGYIAIGVGFLWLSVLLVRRIRAGWLRAAISAAVFAFWFAPGAAVGEGGAMIVPEWMAFWGDTSQFLSNSHADPTNPWPLHWWLRGVCFGLMSFAVVWVIAFAIILSIAAIRRRLQKNAPTT